MSGTPPTRLGLTAHQKAREGQQPRDTYVTGPHGEPITFGDLQSMYNWEPTGDRLSAADQNITHPPDLLEPEYRGHLGVRLDSGTFYGDIIGTGRDAEGVRYTDIVRPDGTLVRQFPDGSADVIGNIKDTDMLSAQEKAHFHHAGWAGLPAEVKERIVGQFRGGFDPNR